jgi:hypothetical protein
MRFHAVTIRQFDWALILSLVGLSGRTPDGTLDAVDSASNKAINTTLILIGHRPP